MTGSANKIAWYHGPEAVSMFSYTCRHCRMPVGGEAEVCPFCGISFKDDVAEGPGKENPHGAVSD